MRNKAAAAASGLQPERAAEKGPGAGAVVVVAVRAAAREISKTAVVWALTHVVQHGDSILLLVVIPPPSSGRKFWGFPFFAGDCASGHKAVLNQKSDVSELCSQMMLKLHEVYDPNKINVKVRILSGLPSGTVATESKRAQASWVVLDKELKHEEKRCLEELQCNIVVMKRSRPKVLRLNLVGSPEKESNSTPQLPPEPSTSDCNTASNINEQRSSIQGPSVTPSSSPESEAPFDTTDAGTSSVSSSDPATSPFCASDTNSSLTKEATKDNIQHSDVNISDSESEVSTPPAASSLKPWMADILQEPAPTRLLGNRPRRTPTADSLLEKIAKLDLLTEINAIRSRSDLNFRGNVRDAVSLSRRVPPGPPPLCSICQHKTPVFGKPPRWFSYAELELATGGFSQANFLAEGGFGSVHRGVLPDGQAIAVKQHKLASSQGDVEFCSEVEVLSCAQHRNVVMLIGFCVEDKRRLLVYEYICNGSLDSHLYGRNEETLEWSARQKIAAGAARGLRYLHEECRVGCIIHRDMRPNNILVTHDFEPLVGDFGLARWQPDGDMGVETRVIGTFGYLAPEYAQSGQTTEKADVYSFGVVLVELVTGRKAVDINRPKGQQFLTEWARTLLEDYAIDELIDPRLGGHFCENEVYCMLHAANLCIRRDPHLRPCMSHFFRKIIDAQTEAAEIFENFIDELEPIHSEDAVDICSSQTSFMADLHKLIFGTQQLDLAPQQESANLSDFTFSLVKLGMEYGSVDGHLPPVEQKVQLQVENVSCRSSSINSAPLKKRPLPASLLRMSGSGSIKEDEISVKKTRFPSLNDLQLEKISKLLAARKKKLQFATPLHTQVLVDSMDNKKSDDHHLSESDILISTDFVHKHPTNEDIQLNNLKHSTTDTSFSAPAADLNRH